MGKWIHAMIANGQVARAGQVTEDDAVAFSMNSPDGQSIVHRIIARYDEATDAFVHVHEDLRGDGEPDETVETVSADEDVHAFDIGEVRCQFWYSDDEDGGEGA